MLRTVLRPFAHTIRSVIGTNGVSEQIAALEATLRRIATVAPEAFTASADSTPAAAIMVPQKASVLHSDQSLGGMTTLFHPYCPQIAGSIAVALSKTEEDSYRQQFTKVFNFPRELLFLLKERRGIEDFIDVGANIGHFSLAAGALGLRTFSVEALAGNFILLCQSVKANEFQNIVPYCAAASDRFDTVSMRSFAAYAQVDQSQPGDIPAVPLDAILPNFRFTNPDLIKIDVEGHEIPAIRGLDGAISRSRPLLIVECNAWTTKDNGGHQLLLDQIKDRNYDLFMFVNDGSVTPFGDDDVQHSVCCDYLAVPRSITKERALPTIRQMTSDERVSIIEDELSHGAEPHWWYFRQVIERIEDRYGKNPRLTTLKEKAVRDS